MDTATIEKEALEMPAFKRALLADRLLQSISPGASELHERWAAEAEDRMAAYKAGDIVAVDGPKSLRDLRKRLVR